MQMNGWEEVRAWQSLVDEVVYIDHARSVNSVVHMSRSRMAGGTMIDVLKIGTRGTRATGYVKCMRGLELHMSIV